MSAEAIGALFREAFGVDPSHVASAPARVNLIGEHTDYNGGEVLPIGIDRRTFVAVRERQHQLESRVVSSTHSGTGLFDATAPAKSGEWWDYVAGVVRELALSHGKLPQLDIAIVSDVPAGAGLSSSAALSVATAIAVAALADIPLSLQQAADMAWRGETKFVGMPCGVMDQFASALAENNSALHVWCDTMQTAHVPCREHVLIFDTGVSRGLRGSAFAQRRDECAAALSAIRQARPDLHNLAHATMADIDASGIDDALRRRATHVVLENARVKQAVEALTDTGTIPGDLLNASHASLRDLYECSSPELDWFTEFANAQSGIRGARLTGAGWGGCAIATGDESALNSIVELVSVAYAKKFSHQSRIWIVKPTVGARLET